MSNIRVFVHWEKSTVFAGEDVKCQITFKNNTQRSPNRPLVSTKSQVQDRGSARERWKDTAPLLSIVDQNHHSLSSNSNSPQTNVQGHGSRIKPNPPHNAKQMVRPDNSRATSDEGTFPIHKHKRSVSIISIGADVSDGDGLQTNGQPVMLRIPARGHSRALSLQVLPRPNEAASLGTPSVNERTAISRSPLSRNSISFASQGSSLQSMPSKNSKAIVLATLASSRAARDHSGSSTTNFKFPKEPTSKSEEPVLVPNNAITKAPGDFARSLSPRPPRNSGAGIDHINPNTRIASPASLSGTPRSSGDFYSVSNNSTETLASEYIAQDHNYLSQSLLSRRRPSLLRPASHQKPPETLMMGYGQIVGSFTLDGSLVNQAPFEEAKRKGIMNGQSGGGVVGIETTKRENRLLGSLGWGHIGESLGGLLGGSELSSIKEMKSIANTKSVPILSTPQSILFVDLQLGPGESRTYTYSHALPRGIPPSHRGRAIKISYNLVIGIQRATKSSQQHDVRLVDVPFRVLPGVNGRGDILGHNLMSPYIILQKDAHVSTLNVQPSTEDAMAVTSSIGQSDSSIRDFLAYAEKILDKPRQNSSLGLLSPTEDGPRSRIPEIEDPISAKDAIDLAILQSNSTTLSRLSPNRFEITRSGDRVAVIMLARPAYRLGETIYATVNFSDTDISCYSLHATLETSETIDPAIALRSKSSIQRVTRRIHASLLESAVFARRTVFSPTIPFTSTPDFLTSGINLEWSLRFEFVISRARCEGELNDGIEEPMEEVARDERGTVTAAVQDLSCESINISLPIRVYGATGFNEKNEVDDLPI